MGLIQRLLALLGVRVTPESLTKQAAQYAAREDTMRSVESYKQALAMDPLYVPAYDGLGRVYFRLGFREEADREFAIADGLESLVKDPADVQAAIKMGRAMLEKEMYKIAASLLEPVLKLVPDDRELLKVLGANYKALGHFKRARELYQYGLDRWPQLPDFHLEIGEVDIRTGREAEGQKLISYGRLLGRLAANPMDAGAQMEMAKLHLEKNAFNDAAKIVRQLLKNDRKNQEYWLFLGEIYLRSGLYPAAEDTIKQAAKLMPSDPRPQKLLASTYRLTGRLNESKAAKELAAMLEAGQKEGQTPGEAAKFIKYLLSIGDIGNAEARLGQLLIKWPDSSDLLIIQARLLYKNKSYPEAVNVLKAVAEERPTWAEPHMWLAMCYQRMGDNMAALAEGQLSTRLAPKSHAVHKVLGDILREQKKFAMAENAYETADNLKAAQKDK